MLNLLCVCSVNGTTKPEGQHICVQHHLLITPTVETYCSEKQRFLSNYDYSMTMHQETDEEPLSSSVTRESNSHCKHFESVRFLDLTAKPLSCFINCYFLAVLTVLQHESQGEQRGHGTKSI